MYLSYVYYTSSAPTSHIVYIFRVILPNFLLKNRFFLPQYQWNISQRRNLLIFSGKIRWNLTIFPVFSEEASSFVQNCHSLFGQAHKNTQIPPQQYFFRYPMASNRAFCSAIPNQRPHISLFPPYSRWILPRTGECRYLSLPHSAAFPPVNADQSAPFSPHVPPQRISQPVILALCLANLLPPIRIFCR